MKDQANTSLSAGAPFISQSDAQAQLDKAGVPKDVNSEVIKEYDKSQIDGLRTALSSTGRHGRDRPVLHRAHPEEAARIGASGGGGRRARVGPEPTLA